MLIDDYYRIQDDLLALMKRYADDLTTILSGQKVCRHLQVESKVDAISRFELAKGIPLTR